MYFIFKQDPFRLGCLLIEGIFARNPLDTDNLLVYACCKYNEALIRNLKAKVSYMNEETLAFYFFTGI